MSKWYSVSFPVIGHATKEVLADSEDEAIGQAYEAISIDDFDDWDLSFTEVDVKCDEEEEDDQEVSD